MESYLEMPENYPTVVMDISLGKKYSTIEFDYEAFERERIQQGIPDESTNEITIFLEKRSLFTPGHFHPKTREIRINADHRANKNVAHELSHISDGIHGLNKENILTDVCRIGLRPSVYIAIGATGLTFANLSFELGIDGENLAVADYAILVGMGVLTVGHALEAGERKANKAARKANNAIFRTTRR